MTTLRIDRLRTRGFLRRALRLGFPDDVVRLRCWWRGDGAMSRCVAVIVQELAKNRPITLTFSNNW